MTRRETAVCCAVGALLALLPTGCERGRDAPQQIEGAALSPGKSALAGTCELAAVIGAGKWMYAWPHDRVPTEIEGYTLVDSPINVTPGNRGRTVANWGKPVVFQSVRTRKRVSVRCNRDYSGVEFKKPWWQEPRVLEGLVEAKFHGLKAASGSRVRFDLSYRIGSAYFAFREGDIVYEIDSVGESPADARRTALEIAEAIYKHLTVRR